LLPLRRLQPPFVPEPRPEGEAVFVVPPRPLVYVLTTYVVVLRAAVSGGRFIIVHLLRRRAAGHLVAPIVGLLENVLAARELLGF
jgi:hypothetical protein